MRPALYRSALLACTFALPLAACNSGPEVSATNATQAEVQAQVEASGAGEDITIEPGRWEGTMTIHTLDMPGIPPAAREQMKAQMGAARNFANCVTPEDVKAQKAFFTGDGTNDPNCKYDHFNLKGGKIDAALSCNRPEGKMTMTMDGDYAPDRYRMDMASKVHSAAAAGAMDMKMSVEAKRVGDCRGTPDES